MEDQEKRMDKLKLHSPDFIDQNIAWVAERFPSCITESAGDGGALCKVVDFEQLRQELSECVVDGPRERYQLDWPGKKEALLAANAPIAKTLRPSRDESVEFETTRNLFIEGENLDALKLLQETYLGKVKMVYIDPPYNTGKDFIYSDRYSESTADYLHSSGQEDDQGGRLLSNAESNGRFHSNWLSMMYSRLKLARNLLGEDGLIVVHIDENEYPNLEKLLSEVFGEANNLGTVVWDKRNPKGDATGIAQQHELISYYCKNRAAFKESVDFKRPKDNAEAMLKKVTQLIKAEGGVSESVRVKYKAWLRKTDFSGGDKAYSLIDGNGDVFQPVSMAWPNKKTAPEDYFVPLTHPVSGKECPVPEKGWRNPTKTMSQLLGNGLVLFGEDETTQPRRKYLLRENLYENVTSLLYYGGSDEAMLSDLGVWFDTPKSVNVSMKILQSATKDDDVIVDFFAGSATSAHAVMQLNALDGGKRKFIMVQLPEDCSEDSGAFKAGHETISEIGKHRIRQAGVKIMEENGTAESQLDIGFRVLKVDSSNMKEVYYAPDSVKQSSLPGQIENVKEGRTPEDLLFQVLLDWGLDLSLPIAQETIEGKAVFFVDDNALAACFDSGLNEELVKTLAARKPLRAVFRDSGYGNDSVKINVEQIFKLISPSTEVKSI
jgi:adenine-specific DNA-methyltransferase